MTTYFVYILTNKKNGTLYLVVTNNLCRRVYEHRLSIIKGFTKKYKLSVLVYYEEFQDINLAIGREKQLKNWERKWKIKLIEKKNQGWIDLFPLYCSSWIPDQSPG